MNIYDKATELAAALKDSQEVKDITLAMSLINEDESSKRMLEDFRSRQMTIQQRMMAGDMPAQEEMEAMEKLFDELNLNLSIRRLFDAERRLSVIIEDINKMISDSLQNLYGGQGL